MPHQRCVFKGNADPSNPAFMENLVNDEYTELTFVYDSMSEVSYLSVRSPKAWVVQKSIDVFTTLIEAYSLLELLQIAKTRLTLEPHVLFQIALLIRKPDAEVVSIFREALDHRLPAVRYFAARAIGVTQWNIFVADLELALKLEDDADVLAMAEYALRVCNREVKV